MPQYRFPSRASARTDGPGHYTVRTAAVDIGTGARTVLARIAADALRVDVDHVTVEVGDSAYPSASWAGRSSGTTSWGTAVVRAPQRRTRANRAGLRRASARRQGDGAAGRQTILQRDNLHGAGTRALHGPWWTGIERGRRGRGAVAVGVAGEASSVALC
ncbi:molybdopterin cofactor-binding domain-containing protein [Streptomyces sp. NPDC102278]|uniref:molybdopterin cofactor-binding domain-containing protein n=1 Tax=Streptomyces sp. NPDC102278 TaxID=3366152 RepID=UPI0038296FCD